ncbi:hypothetical protein [Kitasatospora sp. CB02891]|uniref:hypothetical protein n=1 Tax=Kitasatospora sp. CB02891 TaxID=2020329 RepID=UPI000C270C91|nr:hypothetical protein [Kitasatospora sp. CB02891]PJN24033.1 hypothetical protein CG736_19235 [Kitasatospora sp. CB02891]
MRIVTAAQQEKTRRLIRLLQQQLADAQAAVLEQAGANGRLAARAETAQAELKSNCVELADSHREMAEQIDRLQGQVRMLQRDRDGLRSQLDHALYDDKQLTLIAAGRTKDAA